MSENLERLVADWVAMELRGDVDALQDLLVDDFAGPGPGPGSGGPGGRPSS